MKNTLVLILLIVFCFITTSYSNAQPVIPWSKETKLKWSDFKAEPNTEILGYAQTSYKIEIQPNNVLVDEDNNIQNYGSLNVIANFYTDHSWVFKKDTNLLKHEQLHFDIAGLYAHKIRLEFEKLKKAKIANFNSYMAVYKKLWVECRDLQKKYDQETSHGLKEDINNIWIENISTQLKSI